MRAAAIVLVFGVLMASPAAGEERQEERSVSDLVKVLKQGDDVARLGAAREIAEREIKSGRTTGLLRKMMLTESGELLLAAGGALERIGAKMAKTVKELTPQLADPEPAARARAAWALSLIPAASSSAPEIAPLLEETDDWVRVSAAGALLRFGHEPERMAELLVEMLGHEEARVRLRAMGGLLHLPAESKSAAEALAKIAAEGGPEGLRACLTLAELGPRGRAALPTLLELLESSDQQVAILAGRAFGALGPDAVKHAPDLLDRSILPSPFMFVARVALAAMGEGVVPILVEALEKGDVIRQQRAVSALELMGPKAAAAVPTLISLLPAARPKMAIYDDWGTVQVTAIRTLGRIGKAARPALPALRDLAALRPGVRFQADASLAVTLIEIAGR